MKNSKVPKICETCKSPFVKRGKKHDRARFCSIECRYSYPTIIQVECKHCGKLFGKKSSNVRRALNHFCNRSCAASFNNKAFPKKPPAKREYVKCKTDIICKPRGATDRHCSPCYVKIKASSMYKDMTVLDYHKKLSVLGKHPSWINAHIRGLNRSWNRDLIKLPCKQCGYDKHVELCHIKAITDFSETATVGEVNALSNNVQLCRNCHWELDHGLITL